MKDAPSAWRTATIEKIVPQTSRVSSFFLAPEPPFAFRAGQHVDVRLTAADGYQARRSYSIASAPENNRLVELAIEELEQGEVSAFFHEVAAVGDAVEIRGPIGGHFVWSVEDGGPLLLVGAGSGVAPLMAMARHRAARGSRIPALLLVAARTWDDVLFREELLELEARGDGFAFVVALSRGAASRAGDHGRRVDAAIAADALSRLPASPLRAFVCGSNAFVETASAGLVAGGLAASVIRTERYGG